MSNKTKRLMIIFFILAFSLGFVFAKYELSNPNLRHIEPSSFLINRSECVNLNTFREGGSSKTKLNFNINPNEKLIDFRDEDKFNRYHIKNTINIPFWKVILEPEEYKSLFNNSQFVCYVEPSDAGWVSHNACYEYFESIMYWLYNISEIKIRIINITDSSLADEFEYYKLAYKLDNTQNYIIPYKEMEINNSVLLPPEKINNKTYINQIIKKDKEYNLICTNDFSCLYSWAVKEKLKSYGFKNINNIIKLLNFPNQNLSKSSKIKKQNIQEFISSNHIFKWKVIGNNMLSIQEGNYIVNRNIIFPENVSVVIQPNVTFNMGKNDSILIQGDLFINGTVENPVIIKSLDKEPFGVFAVSGRNKANCIIHNLKLSRGNQVYLAGRYYSGALSLYECKQAEIINSSITNTYGNDATNIKQALVIVNNSYFAYNKGDQLDFDFCKGNITSSSFIGSDSPINNDSDGLDLGGSEVVMVNDNFSNSVDKGISVGEGSLILVLNSSMSNNGIGVAVKDLSRGMILNNNITNNKIGVYAYQKSSKYGGGQAYVHKNSFRKNTNDYKVDNKSIIINLRENESSRINKLIKDRNFEKIINEYLKGE